MDHSASTSEPSAQEMSPNVQKCHPLADFRPGPPAQVHAQDDPAGPPPAMEEQLSDPQRRAIELLVTGSSLANAAERLGVHRRTISRWRSGDAAFRAELARRRAEVWGEVSDRFNGALHNALDLMNEQMHDSHSATAHRAARSLLSLARYYAPAADEMIDPAGVLARGGRVQRTAPDAGPSSPPLPPGEG